MLFAGKIEFRKEKQNVCENCAKHSESEVNVSPDPV